jgi:hypothetical protein
MGYRFGGEMAYGLYERVSGINSIRWMLEVALGKKHAENDLPKPLSNALSGMVASYFLFSTVDGDINNIEGLDQVENLDNVVIDFPKRVGNTVRKGASLGIIRIYGENGEQICNTLEFINNNLRVTDERGVNMFVRYTDYETLISEYNLGIQQFNG